MNIFLQDPNEIRLPPEEVRLTKLEVMPKPDGKQVRVLLELTPFMMRPNLELSITNETGREVGHTSILETMLHKLEITMHLRQVEPGDSLTIKTTVYYQKLPEPSGSEEEVSLPDPLVVDQQSTIFSLPQASYE